MEIINITEEQRKKLSYRVAQLVFELKKDEKVECIYFLPYKYNEEEGNFIELLIATKAPYDLKRSQIVRDFNAKNNKDVSKYGVRIHIDTRKDLRYFPDAIFDRIKIPNFNSLIGLEIFNATILFDRNGKYRDLKEIAEITGVGEHSNLYTYDNLASIVPPIEEKIDGYLEDMEGMNNREVALKKFTKTSMYEEILKM